MQRDWEWTARSQETRRPEKLRVQKLLVSLEVCSVQCSLTLILSLRSSPPYQGSPPATKNKCRRVDLNIKEIYQENPFDGSEILNHATWQLANVSENWGGLCYCEGTMGDHLKRKHLCQCSTNFAFCTLGHHLVTKSALQSITTTTITKMGNHNNNFLLAVSWKEEQVLSSVDLCKYRTGHRNCLSNLCLE